MLLGLGNFECADADGARSRTVSLLPLHRNLLILREESASDWNHRTEEDEHQGELQWNVENTRVALEPPRIRLQPVNDNGRQH